MPPTNATTIICAATPRTFALDQDRCILADRCGREAINAEPEARRPSRGRVGADEKIAGRCSSQQHEWTSHGAELLHCRYGALAFGFADRQAQRCHAAPSD